MNILRRLQNAERDIAHLKSQLYGGDVSLALPKKHYAKRKSGRDFGITENEVLTVKRELKALEGHFGSIRKVLLEAGFGKGGSNVYELLNGKRDAIHKKTAKRIHELYKRTFFLGVQTAPNPTSQTITGKPNLTNGQT